LTRVQEVLRMSHTSGNPQDATDSDDVKSEDSPFHTVSDIEVSRYDRYKILFDEWVIAPVRILMDDPRAVLGCALVGLFAFLGTLGVMIVRVPEVNQGPRSLTPFKQMAFPLGTDATGRGILAQVVHATPPMLRMIFAGAVFAIVIATIIGVVAGYKGGWTDTVLMTITDTVIGVPGLPFVIVIAAIFEPTRPEVIGIMLASNVWAGNARTIRSQVLTLRDQNYVEASRLAGMSLQRILRKDVLPNIMPFILVKFVNDSRYIIFSSVGLYFLGFLPYSNANWGVMIQEAYRTSNLYVGNGIHWMLPPMFAIILFSLGLILLAQGFDRIFNPQIRAKHAKSRKSDETAQTTEEQTSTTSL
jgi:peptide/nickel transport system permease protein